MKRETTFIFAMFFVGILAGLAITMILMFIAIPQFTQYQLTLAEKADWDRIESYGSLMMSSWSWYLFAAASFAIVTTIILLFLRVTNPGSMMALKKWRSVAGAKLLVVFIASLAWLYLLVNYSGSFYTQREMSKLIQFGIYIVGTAGLWFISGAQGWAGDFSSWRMPHDAEPLRVSLLGAATGIVIFAISYLSDIAAGKYFILVHEVLGGSPEPSFLGFKYLALGSSIQMSLELLIIAGFATALAPVQREAAEIRHRLVTPIVALAAIIALFIAAYLYAGEKYDLDKPDLASAVGVSSKAQNSKTVLIFNPSKEQPVSIQEWPLLTPISNVAVGGNTIELTKDNLHKVESYLNGHPGGTIYTYTAQSAMMTGYYDLWDVQEGLTWHVKMAESQLLSRLLLLARFTSMRVTPENLNLLESFSDDKKWHHSGRSARSLSIAYQHFGKPLQARVWLQKAKDLGADITDTKYLDVPIVTQGSIKGKILLNGMPLSNVKVGLLSHQTSSSRVDSYTLSDLSLARKLQDAVRTNKDGSFAFTELGNGKYLIAIMTEKYAIPFDIKPGQIKVSNVPGLVQIGPAANRDLGIIKIVINHKYSIPQK